MSGHGPATVGVDMGGRGSAFGALALVVVLAGCSAQQDRVSVPDVTDLNEVEAVQTLEAVGLRAEAVAEYQTAQTHGTVLGQAPEPRSRVDVGSTVTLSISREGP